MTPSTTQFFPLSSGQRRLWLLDQLSPGSSLYNVPLTVRLTTAVDVDALGRSLIEILRRHDMLRTTFISDAGNPLQVVHPSLHLPLPVEDLQHLAGGGKEALMNITAREVARPFNLETGPLLRATLYRLGKCEHLLLIVLHHIAADGWSLGLLLSELTTLYTAFLRGDASPLADLPIQYADFAVWQQQQLKAGELDEDLRYWRKQLADLPPFTLPLPRPPAAEPRASRFSMTLPAATTARIESHGRREGATLFMTLSAVFGALLHRYSGERDFALGTVTANRTRAETQSLIGFFVNTLVLRVDVQLDDTWLDLIRRVRGTTLEAFAHQELPFERLVEELQPPRLSGRNPLVQILFTLQNTPSITEHAADQIAAGWELDRGTAGFDLTCDVWNSPAGLQIRWEYRADLFDAQAVASLAHHYHRLLEAFSEQPDQPLRAIPLLDSDERRSILALGLGPIATFPDAPLDHQLARVAAEYPDSVAATGAGETLTHGDLQAAAEALAWHLRHRGVSEGGIVAILLSRTPWLGVAMLAILRAGAAFLTLDPADPPARRQALLIDAGVRVVLSDSGLAQRMGIADVEVLCVDLLPPPGTPAIPEGDLARSRSPDAPAYCTFTSGSTGAPKGVLVSHGALVNHCHAVGQRYALRRTDRVLQLAPAAFDVFLEETLATWLAGGSVHFPAPAGTLAFTELEGCVHRDRITLLNLPASYWHEWVDHLDRTHTPVPESLRLVVCGSERMSMAKLRQWQRMAADRVRLINAYGVTEAAITSLTYEPPFPIADDAPDVVPIGRPLANVHALVLDDMGEPGPRGVVGELHLGGAGVALGYLGRPELSAERFVATALSPVGVRLHRTGDLVRFNPQGELEYIGRRDGQVKVRGIRVDLGEIEATLLSHPAVAEAAVIQRNDADHGLVGFVALLGEAAQDLTSFLRKRLPAAMIPSTMTVVRTLPRNSNGKIDRGALFRCSSPCERSTPVPPSTPLESELARLWASVLRLPQVGITDNFFELGGHSLLATQLLSRVQADLGANLPLRTLFEAPTVAAQAAAITAAANKAPSPVVADPFGPGHRRPPCHRRPPSQLRPEDVERLSDAEVDALLSELLAGGGELP